MALVSRVLNQGAEREGALACRQRCNERMLYREWMGHFRPRRVTHVSSLFIFFFVAAICLIKKGVEMLGGPPPQRLSPCRPAPAR